MKRSLIRIGLFLFAGLFLLAYLEAVRFLADAPFHPLGLFALWLCVLVVLGGALWAGPVVVDRRRILFSWRFVLLSTLLVGAGVAYRLSMHTVAAWSFGILFYAWLAAWSGIECTKYQGLCLLARILLAVLGGTLLPIVGQVESRFSDEEFFVALQIVALSVFVALIFVARAWIARVLAHGTNGPGVERSGGSAPLWGVLLTGVVVAGLICGWAIWQYRHSFYPLQVPSYPGISREHPFLCGQSLADEQSPDGPFTFQRLLTHVEARPEIKAPEYGMLALSTGERRWAEAFRLSLLEDARQARYTESANSVKSTQYLAARRVYYFVRVVEAFPDLFSEQDMDQIRTWLTAVNRRAFTVEWVDWMYALAFAYWPQGPYENQENGAGLLALLDPRYLADDSLAARNRQYLERNQRGWFERFRNTDDAYVYQAEWIHNALFQSEYWPDSELTADEARNRSLAFEWLLLQALPDGAPLGYNYPIHTHLAQLAYLGAELLQDARYVWWSARMLDWVEQAKAAVYAQPGLERAVSLEGTSPDAGSCLMFGDSGLPTQPGPLAPDKVVFRDGWTPESLYLLLNLRFSGWHRYKATNSVVLLYQGRPLVGERSAGKPFSWLPVGRSLFRDKRIPRENLNGLLIPRTGMSAVLYGLTGFGGPWAQDPPYYAQVERFEILGPLDLSRTAIENWRGWQHARTIYFFHGGPILVFDQATSASKDQGAALSWHVSGEGVRDGDSLLFDDGKGAVRWVWPAETWPFWRSEQPAGGESALSRWLYRSPDPGRLDQATMWLTGEWADAEYELVSLCEPGSETVLGYHVRLAANEGTLELIHNAAAGWIERGTLATDGELVAVRQGSRGQTTLCAVGGTQAVIAWASQPEQVTTRTGQALALGKDWSWDQGSLTLYTGAGAQCVDVQ